MGQTTDALVVTAAGMDAKLTSVRLSPIQPSAGLDRNPRHGYLPHGFGMHERQVASKISERSWS